MRDSVKEGWSGGTLHLAARAWWAPLVLLVALALLNRQTQWHMATGWARDGLTFVCASTALWAWRALALAPPLPCRRDQGAAFRWPMVGAWQGIAWTWVWVLLPAWGLLKLVSIALFVPVMAWRECRANRRRRAMALVLGWCVACGSVLLWWMARPFAVERWQHSVWPVDVDRHGTHHAWARLMDALVALSPTGGGWSGVPPVLTRVDDAAWLLRAGAAFGWVPMAVLGCSTVLLWLLVGGYVSRSPVGCHLSLRNRRLGVALALFHALAAALYVTWSMGYLFRPMGALPPFAHAGWAVLTVALSAIVWRAGRQRRAVARQQGADAFRSVDTSGSWSSGWALAGSGWLVLCLAGALGFTGHIAQWEQAKAERANRYRPAPRLELADRKGEHLLVRNVLAYDVWIHSSDFWAASWANPKPATGGDTGLTDAAREAVLLDALAPWPLAAALARERLAVLDRSAEGPKRLLWAQPKEVVDALRERLRAVGLDGVEIKSRWARHYPQGTLTAHALGFASLSTEGYGQEGLELVLDRQLRSTLERYHRGRPLRTSLDLQVQRVADEALRSAMARHGASTGAVMVVDVATSEVRALVSAPVFDPNNAGTYRYPYKPDRTLNQATVRPVALGSLMTPLLVADLLQRGEVRPDTVVALEGEQGLQVGKVKVVDTSPRQRATLAEIVATSSNVGAAKLALRMTETQWQTLLERSGLHGHSGMTGLLGGDFARPDWSAWRVELQATAGQNLSTTLARAVQAYLPLANGGTDRRLSLLASEDRWIVQSTSSVETPRRVLSEQTACELRRMLHQATGPRGTAPQAQVVGVSVAGKTATTTHLPVMEQGGRMRYVPQADALFIGMTPAERPQYLIGVQLGFADGRPRWSGQVAAPVFAQVVRGLLPLMILGNGSGGQSCPMPAADEQSEVSVR